MLIKNSLNFQYQIKLVTTFINLILSETNIFVF